MRQLVCICSDVLYCVASIIIVLFLYCFGDMNCFQFGSVFFFSWGYVPSSYINNILVPHFVDHFIINAIRLWLHCIIGLLMYYFYCTYHIEHEKVVNHMLRHG